LLLLIVVFEVVPRWSSARTAPGHRLPNRDYWLEPERIAATRAFLQRNLMLMGNLHLLLVIFAVQLAIMANFSAPPRLHPAITWGLGLYFVCLVASLGHFYLRFRKPR
jgi:hypothetical protein